MLRINNGPTDMSLDDYTGYVRECVQNNSNFQVIDTNSKLPVNNPLSSVPGLLKEGH